MSELENLRERFDAVDDELVAALKKRFELAKEMRALKIRENLPSVDPKREQAIIARILDRVDPADRDTLVGVYEKIFGGSRGVIETIARGVCVVDGKVLLCKPKKGNYTYLPGGHIEFGETAREALIREMKEETGLDVEVGPLLGVVENQFIQNGKRHAEISLVFRMTLSKSGVCPQESGVCPQVATQEDWIEFLWSEVSKTEETNLLPKEIIKYVS